LVGVRVSVRGVFWARARAGVKARAWARARAGAGARARAGARAEARAGARAGAEGLQVAARRAAEALGHSLIQSGCLGLGSCALELALSRPGRALEELVDDGALLLRAREPL